MKTQPRTPRPTDFARGNQAASKGEPRTVTLTIRIPASVDAVIRRLAVNGRSRADVVIGLIEKARG